MTNSQAVPIVVAMATYNGERYLRSQLDSILDQTVRPSKILVSDDSSTDRTVRILHEYSQFAPLEIHVNKNRLGVVANFKHAVSMAKGSEYIALADQDDVWLPGKLERLRNLLTSIDDRLSPAMVYSDLAVVNRDGVVLNQSFWNELGQDGYRHALPTLLFGNFVTGCSVLMNPQMADEFKEMPLNVSMHDAWLALIAFTFGRVELVSTPLVHYRKHDSNVAHSESYRKPARLERWSRHLYSLISGDKEYLKPELSMAEQFYNRYGTRLSPAQAAWFEQFLSLKGKSFFTKKLAFRRAFQGYWK